MTRPVYIVDGARTPFLKARGKPGPFTPVDLAVQSGRPLLVRQTFGPDDIDLVILGCVNVIADEMNPARVAALRLGLGAEQVAFTVQINCGSGMQSIDTGFRYIEAGRCDVVLAGGTEALSHTPLVLRQEAVDWYADMAEADGLTERARLLGRIRPEFLKPVIGLERGLTDPISGLNMGQTAEVLAYRFGISREMADAYALDSHRRLKRAQDEGWLEIEPAIDREGQVHDHDDGVRPESDMQTLASLSPVFEKPHGKVTPANASQITDGASWVVLASEKAVKAHALNPIARIVDSQWSALAPEFMGLGPVISATQMLRRRDMACEDIGLWEINEAFAAQVLACLAAWQDEDFCRKVLGLDGTFGRIDRDLLNIDGGAISLGHPVGTSGNRITLHLATALRRLGKRHGVATECIGGGQGGAMLLEAV